MAGQWASLAQHLDALDAAVGFPSEGSIVTTGAATITADYAQGLLLVTTGGTGGNEIINLPNISFDTAMANIRYIGRRVTIVLSHQTNPADVVVITTNGSSPATAPVPAGQVIFNGNNIQASSPGVLLDYEGACASFVWAADTWYWDFTATDGLTDTVQAAVSVEWEGSTVRLKSDSGYIYLEAKDGKIAVVNNLPTSDPVVKGALWNSTGTVKISAGP